MNRLFFKILLWFWLGVVAVSGTLVTLTELSHSRAEDDRRWREKYGPRVDLWARQEVHILRVEGNAALEKYVNSFQSDPGVTNYIFDADGREVLGRAAPRPVVDVLTSMNSAPEAGQRFVDAQRIIGEKIVGANGRSYVVTVDFPQPSLLSLSLFDILFEDFDRAAGIRLGAVIVVAGIVCFWFARQIVKPIDRLRMATREIAAEQLHARVDPGVLARGDELADLGRDFDRMADRIEQLVMANRRLLADVSHALRSPLARLNVALGLIRRTAEPESLPHVDRIQREADRLNILIGQLLTMARLDSGVDQEQKTVFDIGALVSEVAADADYEARSRRRAVRLASSPECLVEGVREMLRGAIENVVRNAVRHTPEQTSVDIVVSSRTAGEGCLAAIVIRDHGSGVLAKSLPGLFQPFHRNLDPGPSNPDGAGLGLAITKRTFEVHGGVAYAANASGGGLVVTLELPALAATSARKSDAA
jgi:signal transduction histidine kinase